MNTDSELGVELFLQSWWSKHYNRPMKDPMLKEYSIFELMYEYYDKQEREYAAENVLELEADKIEEGQEKETFDWIEEEERKEREIAEAAEAESKAKEEDEAWMLKQLKEEHGDNFGEDLDVDF